MKISFLLTTLFISFYTLLTSAAVEFSDADQKNLDRIVRRAQDNKDPKKFLESIKEVLPAEVYAKLSAHIKDLHQGKLPKISLNKDTVTLESGRQIISMKVISALDQVFVINSKLLDFSNVMDVEERWQMLSKSLPKLSALQMRSSNPKALLLMEQAFAEDAPNLMRLGGPLGATAAVGVMAATNLWNPYGWTLMAVSYALWNEGVCDDITKQIESCWFERKALEKKLEANTTYQSYRTAKSRQSRECKGSETSSEDREVFANLKSYIHGLEEKSRQLATCSHNSKHDEFVQCVKDYSMQAYFLCTDIPPTLSGYTESWARQGLKKASKEVTK